MISKQKKWGDNEIFLEKEDFGFMGNGKLVSKYRLTNANDISIEAINYGAAIQSIKTPSNKGILSNIVLNFDDLDSYIKDKNHIGVVAGRFAGRIANASFKIKDQHFLLEKNLEENHIHGGFEGFGKKFWNCEPVFTSQATGLKFTYTSPDGEGGYPGELKTEIIYWLDNDNALSIDYKAQSSKDTIINLTQHSYFNLSGKAGSIFNDHQIEIPSSQYLPLTEGFIPTGEIKNVEETIFNLRIMNKIEKTFDTTWVLPKITNDDLIKAANVYHPQSGRFIKVETDQPGFHFYSGDNLDSSTYNPGDGFCLETQNFPDAPNHKNFPNSVLEKGDVFKSRTKFIFGISN